MTSPLKTREASCARCCRDFSFLLKRGRPFILCEDCRGKPARPPRTITVVAFPPAPPPRFVGSCRARCAQTGLQCQLPAHPSSPPHAHGRTRFTAVASEGQTVFAARAALEEAATGRREALVGESERRAQTAMNRHLRAGAKARKSLAPTRARSADPSEVA